MSATFNASNLSSFYASDNLRTNPLKEEENDVIEDKSVTSMWDEAYLDPIDMNPMKK